MLADQQLRATSLDPPMYSVKEFCRTHRISRAKFYEILAAGDGPEVLKLGRRTLITGEAARAWREAMSREWRP